MMYDHSMTRAGVVVALLVAACGGGGKAEPDDTTPEPTVPPKPVVLPSDGDPLDAFHDLLAPLWHAVGPTRMQEVCGSHAALVARVAAVRKAGAPGDLDESAWNASLEKVEKTIAAMKGPCGGSDTTKFESAFTDVHWAFHDYMDLVVGDHGHGIGDGRGGKQGIPPKTP
jgi:hypothetical protein